MNIVSQENIRSIIPAKAARVAFLRAKKARISPLQALIDFYASPIYKDLENESTKVWWQSPEEIEQDWEMMYKK